MRAEDLARIAVAADRSPAPTWRCVPTAEVPRRASTGPSEARRQADRTLEAHIVRNARPAEVGLNEDRATPAWANVIAKLQAVVDLPSSALALVITTVFRDGRRRRTAGSCGAAEGLRARRLCLDLHNQWSLRDLRVLGDDPQRRRAGQPWRSSLPLTVVSIVSRRTAAPMPSASPMSKPSARLTFGRGDDGPSGSDAVLDDGYLDRRITRPGRCLQFREPRDNLIGNGGCNPLRLRRVFVSRRDVQQHSVDGGLCADPPGQLQWCDTQFLCHDINAPGVGDLRIRLVAGEQAHLRGTAMAPSAALHEKKPCVRRTRTASATTLHRAPQKGAHQLSVYAPPTTGGAAWDIHQPAAESGPIHCVELPLSISKHVLTPWLVEATAMLASRSSILFMSVHFAVPSHDATRTICLGAYCISFRCQTTGTPRRGVGRTMAWDNQQDPRDQRR